MKMATGELSMVKGGGMIFAAAVVALALVSAGVSAEDKAASGAKKPAASKKAAVKKEIGLNAIFETSMGTVKVKLFEKEAPVTVANFTELAEGKREWTDPKTGEKSKKKFYDGLAFHRVIPNFMIQG